MTYGKPNNNLESSFIYITKPYGIKLVILHMCVGFLQRDSEGMINKQEGQRKKKNCY
jgi:hypothetical protein